jgi:hypothetical protein
MNIQNLRKLIARIEANRSDFDQSLPDRCIVGNSVALAGERVSTNTERKRIAREFLGTTQERIDTFFDNNLWPEPFRQRYIDAPKSREVGVVLDYLRSFLPRTEQLEEHNDTLHELGNGLTFNESGLELKQNGTVVSISLSLAQMRKLHLALGKVVWEYS